MGKNDSSEHLHCYYFSPTLNFSGYYLKQETRTAHSCLVGSILGTQPQAKTLGLTQWVTKQNRQTRMWEGGMKQGMGSWS